MEIGDDEGLGAAGRPGRKAPRGRADPFAIGDRRVQRRPLTPGASALVQRLRDWLVARHFSARTIEAYLGWATRYLEFHEGADIRALGAAGIDRFLTAMAYAELSASTQNQARAAIMHLVRDVLREVVERTEAVVRAKRPTRVPTVLTPDEAIAVLGTLPPQLKLPAGLLFGSGLRLLECLQLRVKDVDRAYRSVTVRGGKGAKDRVTPLAESLIPELRRHLATRRQAWVRDVAAGIGATMPPGLARKLPRASLEWAWQYVFVASRTTVDAEGRRVRHHLHESTLQRAVPAAARAAQVAKRVSCHTFRHSFATHLLEDGYTIRRVQALLGHQDVRTTMLYLHVVEGGGLGVRSPLDAALRAGAGRRRRPSGGDGEGVR